GIDTCVVHWQPLAVETDDLDGERRRRDPRPCKFDAPCRWLNCKQPGYVAGDEGQVVPGAEPDLEHFAGQASTDTSANLARLLVVHHDVDDVWQYALAVEAHGPIFAEISPVRRLQSRPGRLHH